MKKLYLLTAILLTVGCNNPSDNFAFNEIRIHHQSADVNPEYQRSYTIEATPNDIHVMIEGSKSILLDTHIDNSSTQFAEYTKAYEYLDKGVVGIDTTCSGCPIREITLIKDTAEIYHAKWNMVDNHPALQRLVDVVINSIPGFGELLARPEQGVK